MEKAREIHQQLCYENPNTVLPGLVWHLLGTPYKCQSARNYLIYNLKKKKRER